MDLNTLRKSTLEKVKNELVKKGIVIYREELKNSIQFSVSGLKECINQPCSHEVFFGKIELISDRLEIALRTAKYMGYTEYQTHPKEHVLGYHYLKTEVRGGIPVYFNVQLTVQGKLILYSITERMYINEI
jgi:hypothetical protein